MGDTNPFLVAAQVLKQELPFFCNNTFVFEMQHVHQNPNERFIICDIKTKQKHITLATIYAPNNDDPTFFEGFFQQLSDFKCEEIIIGGDFK